MTNRELLQEIEEIFIKATKKLQEKFNTAKLYEHYEEINTSGDLITAFDREANEVVRELIDVKKDRLPLVLISEETGIEYFGDSPKYFLLLDPVDGSNNVRPFRTPPPYIAMSMGIGTMEDLKEFKNPEAITASVHGDIFSGRMYSALNGEGAFYKENGQVFKITTSPICSLKQKCLIGVDLDNKKKVSLQLQNLLESEIIQRRLGSSILDFCQLASGQYDAYVSESGRLKVTDISQTYHLVKQAGGILEYKLLLNGSYAPALEDDFLWRILDKEDLLAEIKFQVFAAGNKMLHDEIKRILEIYR